MTIKLSKSRKVYTCKTCSHAMFDHCVTSCDCMPEKNEFYEENYYSEAQLKQAIKDALHDVDYGVYQPAKEIEVTRHFGSRAVTHWMQLPPPPKE